MNITKLSHSQVSKFQQCGKAYEFWYLKKIRPTKFRGALLFGSALDKAIVSLLTGTEVPEEVFAKVWRFQEINKKMEHIPKNPNLVYAKNDFDKDLITNADCEKWNTTLNDVMISIALRDEKGFENLSNEDKSLINLGSWICLEKKGYLMIEAFRTKVLPKLTKIHSTQEYIELTNDSGDTVIGYIDMVANVEGYDVPVVLDLKTSAMEYKEDSVLTSPQLSLYVHAVSEKYNTRKAGFIVLNKHIIKNRSKICSVCAFDGSEGRHKTCPQEMLMGHGQPKSTRCGGSWNETLKPEVYVQFIVDDIPPETEDLVLENIDDINTAIKTGHFTRNLSMCTNTFGGLCDYLDYCYRGSMKNLVVNE